MHCKKESQVKSKKMAFSQEKSTKSQNFLTFCWLFLTKSCFFLTLPDFLFYRGPCVRCHWKHDIVDTFTHHICANRHGGTIGTGFPYIRQVDRRTFAPVQYIVLSSLLCWHTLLYSLQPSSQPFYKVSIRPSLLHNMLCNIIIKVGAEVVVGIIKGGPLIPLPIL